MEHIKVVAVQIGPRGPTSENERKASQYIQSNFERDGQEVIVDKFASPSTFSWYYAVPCFVVFISFAIFLFHPLLAFIVSLLGLFFFIMEINTKETISFLYPKRESQNVIARIKPEKAAANKVVIVAHHDTSKPSISFHPKLIRYFRASIILMIFSVLFIPLMYGLIIIFSMDWIFFYISLLFSFYLMISVLVLIHRELVYTHIDGANDNASGVGVLLGLSEALSRSKPLNTEVWLLSTGCEEVGTIGMIRFLKKYGKELSDPYFICIDNVGKGLIRYTEAEGLIKAYKCSKELVEHAKISSSNLNINAKAFVCRIYPTNALPCLVRGYKVISILSTDEKGLIHNWHWETDTIENLDASTINSAFDLVLDMVKSLDVDIQQPI
jgi:hypothetical protein